MVQKMAQKMAQKMVQKNSLVHILSYLPYAIFFRIKVELPPVFKEFYYSRGSRNKKAISAL